MAQKKNKNKQSGQLARLSQNNSNSAPVAMAKSAKSTAPKINSSPKMTRIIHRELVQTISGNTTFNADSFALNPGLSGTFPWLSSIAGSFEQYRFNKLVFHYVTRAPTSYIGSILLAPEYDALDSPPSSEVEASQMVGAVEDSPWKEQFMSFNVQDMFPMGPRKYIRTGTISGSSDLKTYDAGQLFVCEVSCADTSSIGKLWVEYDVELHIPQNPSTASAANVGSMSAYTLTTQQSITSATDTTVLFDNAELDTLGLTNTSGVFTVPAGSYQVTGTVFVHTTNSSGSITIECVPLQGGSELSHYDISQIHALGSNLVDFLVPFNFVIVATASDSIAIRVKITSSGVTLPANMSSIAIQKVG